MKYLSRMLSYLASVLFLFCCSAYAGDPLPSWNKGAVKNHIIQFVKDVTNKNSPDYVAPENRIAVFDNDGTLWVEQPAYNQVLFSFDRVRALAPSHPEWKTEEPFKSVLNKELDKITYPGFLKIVSVTNSGMSVEQFDTIEKKWLLTAKHPRFNRPYTELVYQPMLEAIRYLHQHDFKVYIVSGGSQEFIRVFSQSVYGIPPERVIGTAMKTNYVYENNQPKLLKTSEILLKSNHEGKPEAIHLFIGKKPIIAFGNSDGDKEMLEWTQSSQGKNLMLLVHHDDAKREYAYDTQSKVGAFSKSLMQKAIENDWQIISMKNDWKVIFPEKRH